jgi:hypothetical protein
MIKLCHVLHKPKIIQIHISFGGTAENTELIDMTLYEKY